jgi:peptidoglycan/xylan/chitin deacetylase (PgdA/CDA1 family)
MKVITGSTALRWAAAGIYHTGLIRPISLAAGYAARTPTFQILTYHRVNDEQDPFFPSLPTAVFEQHMAYIARSCTVLTVEDLVTRARGGSLPRNALAITFDDGYRDNLTHAAPILARYGLPATIFLTTGWIGTGEVPWFDQVALALKGTRRVLFEAPWGETVSVATPPERIRALYRSLGYLKQLPDTEFRRDLQQVLHALGPTKSDGLRDLMLTWAEVRTLAGMNFSIGAHTVTHPILSKVGPRRAWEEIQGSKAMIESACGRPPRAFAYPNGRPEDYNHTITQMVREAAFVCAVTTRFGANTRDTSPYELRRGGPWEYHRPSFALKLAWYRLVSG